MKFLKSIILDLFNLRKQKNELVKQESKLSSELKGYMENNSLNSMTYKNISVSIGTRSRKEFDKNLFKIEHPTIDIEKYFFDKPFDVLNFTEL